MTTYRSDIDGLRGVAILLVIIYHIYPKLLPSGFIGVDLFFVISGYLITKILLSEKIKLSEFYFRRARRILPALILVILSFLFLAPYWLLPTEIVSLSKHSLAGLGFYSNFLLNSEVGYFDHTANEKPLLHLWSLGIEEQFYLFWPACLLIFRRLKFNTLLCTIGLFVISLTINNYYLLDEKHQNAFYLPHSRMWELLIGALLIQIETRYNSIYTKLRSITYINNIISIIGILLFLIGVLSITDNQNYPNILTLLPTLGIALIIFAGPNTILNKHILSFKLLVYLGIISYPLYLWHWPLLVLSEINNELPKIVPILAALSLAATTYICVEISYRKNLHWANINLKSRKVILLVFSYLTALVLSIFYIQQNGYVGRASNFRKFSSDFVSRLNNYPNCEPSNLIPKSISNCKVSNNLTKPSVALIGDSHASSLFPALAERYRQIDKNLILMNKVACLPFANERYEHPTYKKNQCTLANNQIKEFILGAPFIDTVIFEFFVHNIAFFNFSRDIMLGGIDKTTSPEIINNKKMALVASIFNERINEFIKAGKKVIIIGDSPRVDLNPSKCFKRPFQKNELIVDCRLNQDYLQKQNKLNFELYNNITDKACIFRAEQLFKIDNKLLMQKDAHFLYENYNHLSNYGADLVANEFAKSSCFK